MYEDKIETLMLFNYKADRLERSKFRNHLLETPPQITLNSGLQNKEMLQSYPNEEYVDACVLTVRLFIQKNDRIAIYNIKKIYNSLPINADKQSRFDEISNSLNAFLADKSLMQVNSVSVIDGSANNFLSKLGVLDAFVYGELSHFTKRIAYNDLNSNSFQSAFYSMEFASILSQLIDYILAISKLNGEVITDLSANS